MGSKSDGLSNFVVNTTVFYKCCVKKISKNLVKTAFLTCNYYIKRVSLGEESEEKLESVRIFLIPFIRAASVFEGAFEGRRDFVVVC